MLHLTSRCVTDALLVVLLAVTTSSCFIFDETEARRLREEAKALR